MIELVTGTPGAGKTLYTLQYVKEKAEKENRPVFYSGIPELTLSWTEIDPTKWFEAPANSIVVIDESQRTFRPRGIGGKVPECVERLETHRHQGIDLVLITQHPMLIESNVRRLVGRHFHVARRFGMKRATVLEFETCKDQPLAKAVDAVRHSWRYPKEAFGWYKSAEVHTHKARIPARLWLLALIPVLLLYFGWSFYNRHGGEKVNPAPVEVPSLSLGQSSGGPKGPMSKAEYLRALQPRVQGLAHTAAYFDDITKPVRAPYPVGCVEDSTGCRCFSVQGVAFPMEQDVCKQVLANGFFRWWDEGQKMADKSK